MSSYIKQGRCQVHGDILRDGCCATCTKEYWESDEGKADQADRDGFPIRW
jgi:hypothetical protein